MSIYALAMGTFVPVLNTLSSLLDKGAEHARAKGGDPEALIGARLAPDMFPLSTQVQIACHHAKDATARLIGATPPKIDNEILGLVELKSLIARTVAELEGSSEAAFEGTEGRSIQVPLQGSAVLECNGFELLRDWSIPHFYFHVVTAYDILRSNGVDIGKRDYMKHLGPHIRQLSG
jgi:hypothetical protein